MLANFLQVLVGERFPNSYLSAFCLYLVNVCLCIELC